MTRDGNNSLIAKSTTVLVILLIFAAFATAILVARGLGLSRADPSSRMRLHAIPVAISQIYHGRIHDYTADWQVAMQFHSEKPLAVAIQGAINVRIPPNDRTYYWVADDRGLSDFVNLGFRMLGPSMGALFYFWFAIFGASITVAVIRFWQDPTALTLIACTAAGVASTLPAFARATSATFGESSIHLTESRMFDLLASIAAVHLMLTLFRHPAKPRWLDIGTSAAQAALIAVCVHARGSVAYLFIAVIALALIRLLMSSVPRGGHIRRSPIGLVLAVVAIAWAGIHVYQNLMFNEAYKTGIGPRTFWHNALMGLSANSTLAGALNVRITDKSAVDAVVADMHQRNDPRLDGSWETQNILNSLGSNNIFDWRTYESVAHDLVIRTLIAHPGATLKLIFWDKPKEAFSTISCSYLMIEATCEETILGAPTKSSRNKSLLVLLWSLFLFLAAALLYLVRRQEPGPIRHGDKSDVAGLIPGLLFIGVVGLTPAIIIYPSVVQLGGTFAFIVTAFAFSFVLAIQRPLTDQ